jgi:5-methylcytosine-specific restriction protein A
VPSKLKKPYRSDPLYHTAVWQRVREAVLARDNYLCQRCLKRRRLQAADTVHHIKPLDQRPDLTLDKDNLISLCAACHNQIHAGDTEEVPQTRRRARIIKG